MHLLSQVPGFGLFRLSSESNPSRLILAPILFSTSTVLVVKASNCSLSKQRCVAAQQEMSAAQ